MKTFLAPQNHLNWLKVKKNKEIFCCVTKSLTVAISSVAGLHSQPSPRPLPLSGKRDEEWQWKVSKKMGIIGN